jgi:ankyrin repeat protein
MAESFRYDRDFIEGIKKGHVAIVHDFLDHGADVAAREAADQTARQVASARADIAELLTQAGGEE